MTKYTSHILPITMEVIVHCFKTFHIHDAISGNVTSPFARRKLLLLSDSVSEALMSCWLIR